MQIKRALYIGGLTALLSFATGPLNPALERTAQAQDEWGVSDGNSRRAEILRRYKQLVESNPSEGLAYNKMVEYAGGARGLATLIKEYEKKTEDKPDTLKYWLILGHLRKSRSDYELAAAAYARALEIDDKSAIAFLGRGQARMMLQLNAEATEDFEKALALEKNKDKKQDILRKLADLSFAQRDWAKAQEYYDRLVKLDPRSEYLRLEYAQVLVKYKRYDKALEQYEAILKLVGRDVKARATTLRDMGELYEMMGDNDTALLTYKKAQKLVKSSNWLYREVEQRVIGVYRRTDRLKEYAEAREKSWKRPSYDQAMMLAGLFDELGEEQKAFDYYKTASKKSSRSVDPRFKMIQIMQRRGDSEGVIKAYQSLIRVAPREARYQFDLAKIHFRNGDRDKANKLLKKVRSKFGRQPQVMVNLADMYMRFGMNDEALKVYERLVKSQPRNEMYIMGLGEYYYQNGDTAKAMLTWETLLKSNLPKAQAHAQFGLVLVDHGMVERGIGEYEKAVALLPEDPEVQRGLAMAYEMGRYWERAVDTWLGLMRGEPGSPAVAEARGRIVSLYKRQNKLRSKIEEFRAAFEGTPPDMEAGFFLAESYTKLGENERAERTWLRIIEVDGKTDKDDLPALQALEKAYSFRGETEKAIGILQKLAEVRPARARDYYQRIAELSLKNYDDKQAVEYAKLALEKNPDDASAHAKLGDVYAKMQRPDDAIASYKESLDLDPRSFDVYFKLARLYAEIGNREEAYKLYLYVGKRATDEVQVLEASRRLISMSDSDEALMMVEQELAPEVFNSVGLQAAYRKVLMEIYGRLGGVLVARRNAGASLSTEEQARLDVIGNKALPVLMDALQSDDVGQRQMAIRMLGEFGQSSAAVALARLVGDDKEPLRLNAAAAVAKLGDPRAAEIMLGTLKDDDASMRDAAAWVLGGLGNERAARDLAGLLEGSDTSSQQRALAALSLGRVGGKVANKALGAALERAKSERYHDVTALAVVLGLGLSGDGAHASALGDVLKTSTGRSADAAAWALGRVGGDEAVRLLLDAYWSGDDVLRERARRGLTWLNDAGRDDAVSAGYVQMLSESRYIDERADEPANRFQVQSLFDGLVQDVTYAPMASPGALLSGYEDVILKVAKAKSEKLADAKTQKAMWSDLMRDDLWFGLGAVSASDTAMHDARQRVFAGLRDDLVITLDERTDPERTRAALVMLGKLGRGEDLELILRYGASPDTLIRREAIRALGFGYPGDARAHKMLLNALATDSSADVRAQAARVLGGFSTDRLTTVTRLIAALQDESMVVQVHAARSLGELGDERAVEALAKELDKVPRDVLQARVEALAKLDTAEARQVLEPWESHYDMRVRRAILDSRR